MKYCKKCKQLICTDDVNCTCGKILTENLQTDFPCELICTDETNAVKIASLLTKSDVPYSDILTDKVQMIWGNVSGKHTFYVPLCFLKKSVDALVSAGAMEMPPYYDKLEYYDDAQWEELSPRKRKVVKVLSVIAFVVIVYICVAGVDAAAIFIKELFG